MYRIDNTTALATLPTAGPPGVPGFFTEGNPPTAMPATVVDAWWCNLLQEEVLTVIEAAGLAPNKASHRQLFEALQILYQGTGIIGGYLPLTGGALANPGNLTVNGRFAIDAPTGLAATVICNVAGTRAWQLGAWPNGSFHIYDITGGAERLAIDPGGTIAAYSPLMLSRHPLLPYEAATKQYVDDAAFGGGGGVEGGPYLPLIGGTLYHPGVNDPLRIYADTGFYGRIRYRVAGAEWSAGVNPGGAFIISDETAGAVRLMIDPLGTVTVGTLLTAPYLSTSVNLDVGNTLSVFGDANVGQDLHVSRNAAIGGFALVGGTLGVTGYAQFDSTMGVAGNLIAGSDCTVGQSLRVNGASGITAQYGNLFIAGTGSFGGNVSGAAFTASYDLTAQNGNLWVGGTSYLGGAVTTGGNLAVNGAGGITALYGNLFIGGTGWVGDTLTTGYDLRVGRDLVVNAGITVGPGPALSALTVYGGHVLVLATAGVHSPSISVGDLAGLGGGMWSDDEGALCFGTVSVGWPVARYLWLTANGLAIVSNAYKPGGGAWSDLASDQRLKKNIETYERGLAAVCQLRPVTYQFNGLGETRDDGNVYHGLVAQEVQGIMPEMAGERRAKLHAEDDEDIAIATLDTTALTYALVNAVRELADRLETLERRS